jgi:hypothetical protein
MERMSAAEYRALMKSPKPSKMRNIKTIVDSIKFDSKKEAERYCELKILKRIGEVKDFTLQPRYLLVEAQTKNGQKFRKLEYVADFLVTYPDGREEIEDVKGRRTQTYIDKRKMFESVYPHLTIKEIF